MIIILMIGIVAIVLSLLAGSYFRQAALSAQMNSLSRVIEVASQEMLKEVRGYTFDLGMRLGHSSEMVQAINSVNQPGGSDRLVALLDDPFINGFVGFSNINLEKIRIYDLDLKLVAESSKGTVKLEPGLTTYLADTLSQRPGVDRLKAVDALWVSAAGPLHSTLVPIGGLRPIGYLEIIINPVFNLPDIGKITKTPISIFSLTGEPIISSALNTTSGHLPVEFIMSTSDGAPAFRIVGYEDVGHLNKEMEKTQVVTTSGFLLLTISTLLFALWLFNRFLFVPVRRMVLDMKQMAAGDLDLAVNKKGLRDFSVLAETFDAMANQVRIRTNDLERLLDLDDSAILCFGKEGEAVYFNKGATNLFGYSNDEISDLDLRDLFADDVVALMRDSGQPVADEGQKLHTRLTGINKDGSVFESDAVIRPLQGMGGEGYAVVLGSVSTEDDSGLRENVEQRMNAVEQSLNSLLDIARTQPGLLPGAEPGTDKAALREQAVNVMCLTLSCWEHDLGKNKLALAEESEIWPVYIDKSTPTTRTLDKYLNIESCPRNPRTQRVIDTAEFVLKQLGKKTTAERKKLQQALGDFRLLNSGMKATRK